MWNRLLRRFIREAFTGLRQADQTRLLIGAGLAALVWLLRGKPTRRERIYRATLKPGQKMVLRRRSGKP